MDHRSFNRQTVPDRCPIPHIQDFTNGSQDMDIFTITDLLRGYHNIPVAQDDILKALITTLSELLGLVSMSYSLNDAAQRFQRSVDNLVRDTPLA